VNYVVDFGGENEFFARDFVLRLILMRYGTRFYVKLKLAFSIASAMIVSDIPSIIHDKRLENDDVEPE